MRSFELGRAVLGAAVARFFGGGAFSVSSPLASRFLRLSRLLRLVRPSPCADGAGEERPFKSVNCVLSRDPPLGGKIGELILDDGAEDPGAWPDAMVEEILILGRCRLESKISSEPKNNINGYVFATLSICEA